MQANCSSLDFKIRYNGHPLVRVACNGYQGPDNMAMEIFQVNEKVFEEMQPGQVDTSKLQFLCVANANKNLACVSCNLDGHIFAMVADGAVVKAGMPRIRFELRRVLRGTPAAMGMNADSVALAFSDKVNGINLTCRQSICPQEWVRLSNPGGGAVPDIAAYARGRGMRVEGPDQLLTWAQLWQIHAPWARDAGPGTHKAEERRVKDAYLSFAEANFGNMHLVRTRGEVTEPWAAVGRQHRHDGVHG